MKRMRLGKRVLRSGVWAVIVAAVTSGQAASSKIGCISNRGRQLRSAQPCANAPRSQAVVDQDAAYMLISQRVTGNRSVFFVYKDADSGFNHGFPSGFFPAATKIQIDAACLDDPQAPNGCSSDTNRLDRDHGNVLRISFDPLQQGEFRGVNIEEPENFGTQRSGIGYDLRGATSVVFDVRSPIQGGVKVQFGVGGSVTNFIQISQSQIFTEMAIPLNSLVPPLTDLSDVHLLFSVATNDVNAPNGGTILLDNIRFEPVPTSLQTALSFPLGNQTFGVIPLPGKASGRVPIPPDQVLRNLTTIYESSLDVFSFADRASVEDLENLKLLADAIDYALNHENQGDPLPVALDGSSGLHNGYESGDLALRNDQGPGQGKAGQVRLAGFTASSQLCGPSGFCLVLDGASGGNNAFAVLAQAAAFQRTGNTKYLNDARTIGKWIFGNLVDPSATGFGGYFVGYADEGAPPPKPLLRGKSVENNADIFAAFSVLAQTAQVASQQGDPDAGEWTRRANIAGDFVMQMFDSVAGRFNAGTVPAGTPASDGITPNGSQRGNDVINTFDFLDANTFTTLALATADRYRCQIDWRRPVQYVVNNFAQTITAGSQEFQGFNLIRQATNGPNGIAWEFTAQGVVAMRFVDCLYGETRFQATANFYLDQIRRAQNLAPFTDGKGLVAATLQGGDLLPPIEQCLSTPFQCIPERVGLAATNWAIYAERNLNPLSPSGTFRICDPACAFSVSPLTQGFDASGGTGVVNVTASIGCTWFASASEPWIRITSCDGGNGNGSVDYSVETNNGPLRMGMITIAGRTIAVTQKPLPPTITSIVPESGCSGQAVIITGTNFFGVTSVSFSNVVAEFVVLSPTQISATVPATGTTGPISVVTPGGTATSSQNFTVNVAPAITSFAPLAAATGKKITISGANLIGATSVAFGGVPATAITKNTATSLKVIVPPGAITGKIVVTIANGCTAISASDFIAAPSLTSFSPSSGPVGSTVTLTGLNFTGATQVRFKKALAQFTVVNNEAIRATVPIGAKTGFITVVNPAGSARSSTSFTVSP